MSRPLRIAMIAPPWTALPPDRYGGIEAVCAALVDGLVERGHKVTLFGPGSNGTKAAFVQTYAEPQYVRLGQSMPDAVHTAAVARALSGMQVDVVHDHTMTGLLLAPARSGPTVATMHGPLTAEIRRYLGDLTALTHGSSSLHLVAISDDQRRRALDLPWLGRVHNAVRVSEFPYGAHKENFALFLGRCSPEKGMDVAIDAARAAGRHLMLAAKCNEPAEKAYFDEHVRPRLGPDVTWLGEVGGQAKLDLLRRARCLLFPIQWDEPFGMVMIEALACGTPVVALSRGSVPEVVEHGVTGLITEDAAALPRLITDVETISPAACRRAAAQRFDIARMAAGYEELYHRLTVPIVPEKSGGERLAGMGEPAGRQPVTMPENGDRLLQPAAPGVPRQRSRHWDTKSLPGPQLTPPGPLTPVKKQTAVQQLMPGPSLSPRQQLMPGRQSAAYRSNAG